jgi:hypothetical protein
VKLIKFSQSNFNLSAFNSIFDQSTLNEIDKSPDKFMALGFPNAHKHVYVAYYFMGFTVDMVDALIDSGFALTVDDRNGIISASAYGLLTFCVMNARQEKSKIVRGLANVIYTQCKIDFPEVFKGLKTRQLGDGTFIILY